MPDSDAFLAEAANPATPSDRLYELAREHPETWALVAANPNAYDELLRWLADLGDDDVDAALAARGWPEEGEAGETQTQEAGGDGAVTGGEHVTGDGAAPGGEAGDETEARDGGGDGAPDAGDEDLSIGPIPLPSEDDPLPLPAEETAGATQPAGAEYDVADDAGGYYHPADDGQWDEDVTEATELAPGHGTWAGAAQGAGPGPDPSWQPGGPPPPPARTRGANLPAILAGAAAGIAVVLILLFALVPATRFWQDSSGGDEAATAAAVAPQPATDAPSPDAAQTGEPQPAQTEAPVTQPPAPCTTPVSAEVTGAQMQESLLNVTLALHSQCTGGQVLDTPAQRIDLLRDGAGVASGIADLASAPVLAGGPDGSPGTLSVTFPEISFWERPDVISSPGTTVSLPAQQSKSASGAEAPASVDVMAQTAPLSNSQAHDWLEGRAAADRTWVQANLVGQWVPQISSKRPGLKADGITYSDKTIWTHYGSLKSQYPDARLLWSGDWHNYTYDNYWVVIIGQGYFSGDEANYWCDSQGIGKDDCFATQMRTSGTKDGATQFR